MSEQSTEFITVFDAAATWGVSIQRVRTLCREGRIPGAYKRGKLYFIPADAKRPPDNRIHNGRGHKKFTPDTTIPLERIKLDYETIRKCYENAPIIYYIIDPANYQVLYANALVKAHIKGQLEGIACYACLRGRRSPCLNCHLGKTSSENAKGIIYHHAHLKKYLTLHSQPIELEGRDAYAIIAFDSTEEIEARRRAEEDRRRFYGLLNAMPVGLAVFEREGDKVRLTGINRGLEELLSLQGASIHHPTINELGVLVHPDDKKLAAQTLRQAFDSDEVHRCVVRLHMPQKNEYRRYKLSTRGEPITDGPAIAYAQVVPEE